MVEGREHKGGSYREYVQIVLTGTIYSGQPIYFVDNDTAIYANANSIRFFSPDTGTKQHVSIFYFIFCFWFIFIYIFCSVLFLLKFSFVFYWITKTSEYTYLHHSFAKVM
jgi:hypothetical protein